MSFDPDSLHGKARPREGRAFADMRLRFSW